jgi:2',3'-cyclic-nucleotide 2'-phosphodiesterase (5'-nucleotidase family)
MGCQIAIYNAGSIRLDDVIKPPFTEYDILRALPYGGAVRIATIKGRLIRKMIITNPSLKNDGNYLQFSDNVSLTNFTIGSDTIQDKILYKVAIANYLVNDTAKLEAIYKDVGSIVSIDPMPAGDNSLYDVRKAVIEHFGSNCGTLWKTTGKEKSTFQNSILLKGRRGSPGKIL